ncbi:hypothetical protein ACDW82_08325 [Alcaligenes faecalis]|uniref:hypothetical protein n=1 Tax=Alcaligenes faecalis TaxID=511 RepID=UPI003556B34B
MAAPNRQARHWSSFTVLNRAQRRFTGSANFPGNFPGDYPGELTSTWSQLGPNLIPGATEHHPDMLGGADQWITAHR